jgi:outer membrane protein assembly factor BamB
MVWKTSRSTNLESVGAEQRKSFNTPVVVTVNGQAQLISSGAQAVYGYEPRTGKELWRVRFDGYSHSSRPLIGDGVAYINTGFNRPSLMAVRLGGQGDITGSHVLWRYTRNVPAKPSSLLIEDLIYMVDDSGVATCIEAKTGREVWKERVGGAFSASPIYADGRIYLFSENGTVTVLKPGRTFQKLAENKLESGFMASPAVAGKALFLRTKTHLYRIER